MLSRMSWPEAGQRKVLQLATINADDLTCGPNVCYRNRWKHGRRHHANTEESLRHDDRTDHVECFRHTVGNDLKICKRWKKPGWINVRVNKDVNRQRRVLLATERLKRVLERRFLRPNLL